MATKLTDQLVDKRLLTRNLEKGLIDDSGVEKHLSSLKDVAENVESVSFFEEVEEEVTNDVTEGNTTEDAPAPMAATEGQV